MLAGTKGKNDEYGICAKEVHSLLEVAKMFNSKIKMLPQTKTSRSSDSIDSKKIKVLGWKQKHTLKQYISDIKKQK